MKRTLITLLITAISYCAYSQSGFFNGYDISGVNFALSSGIWNPQNNLGRVGNQQSLGFSLGSRSRNLMWDIHIDFRFNVRGNPYSTDITYHDTLFNATYNGGGYVGLDWAYPLRVGNRHEFDILCGAGLDLITYSLDKGGVLPTYRSPNLNFGMGYKIFLNHKERNNGEHVSYVAIEAKYNVVNYSIPDGSNIAGNAYTLTLVYGSYGRLYNVDMSGIGAGFSNAWNNIHWGHR